MAVEATEATSSEPAPTPSESEPVKDSQDAAPPKEETAETTTPPAVRHASNLMLIHDDTLIRSNQSEDASTKKEATSQ